MNQLQVIEHQNQRVLTTSQLTESFGADSKIINRNFQRNQNRYKHGKHYYSLTGGDLKEFKGSRQIDDNLKYASVLYLWTEKGAWLHAKSLNTDKAWDAYEMLVDDYYDVKTKAIAANSIVKEIMNNPEIINRLAEQVAEIKASNNQYHEHTSQKLETIDKKIEGEYATPQDIDAIKYAIKVRAENFMYGLGLQLTIESININNDDIYEQAQVNKRQKQQYRHDLGKVKSSILVEMKKRIGMKGNDPNNRIKRKNVDMAIQSINDIKRNDIAI